MDIRDSEKIDLLVQMHKLFLETLRQREQEIIRYIAILAPSIGGYVLLLFRLIHNNLDDRFFFLGTIGVFFLLTVGSFYSTALGYNFRYLVFEIAQIESLFDIDEAILKGWPRKNKDFLKRNAILKTVFNDGGIPWCSPPEIIRVFWLSFQYSILFILFSLCFVNLQIELKELLVLFGVVLLEVNFIWLPVYYGQKLKKVIMKEIHGI